MNDKILVNIGCGRKQSENMIGIDINNFGQKFVLDLEKNNFPFKDSEVDYLRADHFIEHLTDCRRVLNEAWRILKPEGIFEIYVPYGLWDRQFSPVHKQCITEHWFRWLERNDNEEYYGYKRWKIELLETAEKEDGQKYEIHVKMKPQK